ncbi:MAG: glycosyltransferase family 4 protein [Ruminococcus sp.]|uniref:glycosyltransferase family 4 protein n=1 Tax=Ruminococcus sp. TaxID=41978 RepID=UPI0025EE6526|nr:glycosyltransferase family 4 protein [Ruminococcus sp.]MCR5600628.1 glycosyltransferase family 4 protein [Ruminococcus sp.]
MAKTIMHIVEAPGGVERYLVTLLTKMKKYTEFEYVLVCSSLLDRDKFKGLVKSIIVIDSMHNAISIKNDTKAVFAVRKAIKHYKPDVVYCHSSKAGAIGRIADLGIKNKVIYNAHGWAFNMKSASKKKLFVYEMIERMLAPLTDKIVCISEYEKKSALEHKICKIDKLVLINNGINIEEYQCFQPKSRAELGIPENALVIGMTGRLSKQKAHDIFINMASIVKKTIPEAFFIIVGDDIGGGQFRDSAEIQVKEAGLSDSFLITGWVNDPFAYAACFDIAVLLSRWEGFGLVLPEYMLLGKPIVATRADAIPYVIGDAGVLVDIDDYKSAAQAVLELYGDAELRKRLTTNGKERIGLFDASKMASATSKLFKSMLRV